jgi:hypothetical protein
MLAAFYLKQGPAREVLQVGEHPTPEPGPGENARALEDFRGESVRLEVSQRAHGANVGTTDHSA